MNKGVSQTTLLQPRFGEGFFDDYAGRLISDPQVAIVELVANCWDAGARKVEITWPIEKSGHFEIGDDGTGMTKDEFESIWTELNYNRLRKQGLSVNFPDSSIKTKRTAYGRNGKGRHSLFCFADEYNVETWRNKCESFFQVKRSHGETPYKIQFISQELKDGHGTKISCNITKNFMEENDVRDLLGSKFITDPSFEIYLNKHKIDLLDLKGLWEEEVYDIPDEVEKVRILRLDSKKTGRISKQHGVAWWVNKRLVGEHSWKGFEGAYLDGRTSEAKRYTFIVEADLLRDEVKPDWTGFKETQRAERIVEKVNSYILESIKILMQDIRRSAKILVLSEHKDTIKQLTDLSKDQIGKFVDDIQMKCPTMTHKDLSNTIGILAKLEHSRRGYGLLQQLNHLSPNDLDSLAEILRNWSINDAKKVLDELQWRLKLIEKIESLADNPDTNELHELQPLFEAGLWIFGPEFEGIRFMSNKSLSTIVREFFRDRTVDHPMKRPDFIALPDTSIGVYSGDDFGENGEVCGIDKVLIVELKKGGSKITQREKRQTMDYALEIKTSGNVTQNTRITSYVLGTSVDIAANQVSKEGETIEIIPRPYSTILRQAHARTFNLINKIREVKKIGVTDTEIKEIMSQPELTDFLEKEQAV